MGRGFLSGVFWGIAISLTSLWMVSQLGGMIHLLSTPPTDIAVEAPEAVESETANMDATPDAPAAQSSPSTEPSRLGTTLSGGAPEALPDADTQSASIPQTGGSSDAPSEPTAGDAPTVDVTSETPNLPGAESAAPQQPELDQSPSVAESAPAPAQTVQVEVQPVAPEIPAIDDEGSPVAADTGPAVVVEPIQPVAPTPEPEPNPMAPQAEPETQVAEVSPNAELAPEPEAEIETPALPADGESTDGGNVLAPAGEIGNLAPNVRTNRLPTIGGETAEQAEEVAPADASPDAVMDGPAITAYGQTFENPSNRPLMAILLIDEDGADSASALQDFPFPVSVAIDANRADAVDILAANRAAGRETVILAPLPAGVTPVDVEVSLGAYLSKLPETVAVMDTRDANFQSGRLVSTQVAEVLAATGHGMITYSRGLNSATQVAARAGVPAKLVFRVFDDDGQDGDAIKRFLDQAAFRAGQQSGVILVGHDRPDTIKAIIEWGLGNRAETVALAPVSAALLAE